MSDDKLRLDVERAARARVLIEDELLKEAFATIKESYFKTAWENPNARSADRDGRERLWQAYQIVGMVESHLHTVLEDGNVAQKEIDNLQSMGERRKIFGIV